MLNFENCIRRYMRSGKEILLESKQFTGEDRFRSWFETLLTVVLAGIAFYGTLLPVPFFVKLVLSVFCGLLYVRLFVIYHDYQHRAILQNSVVAQTLMRFIGIYLLAPETIWKRSHEHHHNNNSKLTIAGIGSYPTVSKERYLKLKKEEKLLYLVNRHPLTIIFGYFTLFIYWLNLKSFSQSPSKHMDSLVAILFHIAAGASVFIFWGSVAFWLTWFVPFFLAFALGSYLFYCQHNFPSAKFCENHDWTYVNAALQSTSHMEMNPFMHWVTGNIGYHHVHHVNSRIPFYRLKEAMKGIPELQFAPTTSWNPVEIYRCFMLKLWDPEQDKMITLKELVTSVSAGSPMALSSAK
jgi:acyl-lipid omega-6 desaturase (Delta-12 desaturase)